LVKPERRRIDKTDSNYHYMKHAAGRNVSVQPSTTGVDPAIEDIEDTEESGSSANNSPVKPSRSRRQSESRGRGGPKKLQKLPDDAVPLRPAKKQEAVQPPSLWKAWYHLVTFWCPDAVLKLFGKPQKASQEAWREKMGLISIILLICAFVGFITFGFSATVCPASAGNRLRVNHVDGGYLIIHGKAYDLSKSHHPAAKGVPLGANVLWDLSVRYAGMDASFMFQNVNGNCKGLITAAEGSDVPTDSEGNLGWYFPCNAYDQDGSSSPNETIPYYLGYSCHLSSPARKAYYGLQTASDVYYTWDDVRNSSRNLMVYGSDVMDLDLLRWFNTSQVSYPGRFDQLRENSALRGADVTMTFTSAEDKQIARCFSEIIKVGSVDTLTVGCIASKVVLYVALAFILSVVFIKFFLALFFQWFLSRRYAAKGGLMANDKKRKQEIEDWADDIYRAPPKLEDPAGYAMTERSKRSSTLLPTTSRFTSPYAIDRTNGKVKGAPLTMGTQNNNSASRIFSANSVYGPSDLSLPQYGQDNRTSVFMSEKSNTQRYSSMMLDADSAGPAGFIHEAVVPQPPAEWQPYGYPLAHVICLVTCYSEGEEAVRSTLDSVATTDYPNSHKILLVVCDGMIKGNGEDLATPDIVLGMMSDNTMLPDEVQAYSYVAVAGGSKRHNMAKVYCGFYNYGEDSRIPGEKQQRVPMVVVVKTGTPEEATTSKPGNRGKRDSQIILMSFLQKVMFDERMTEMEYEMFNGIWKITGISPDFYEVVLMVDADTRVFPDSLTHMVSAMVTDPDIMGLCGETKIANKRESWVTAIQVFEYFVSHHLAKSFESVFGGVTCLPGCFSMYRIKAPKGGQNYWVPILANPDIVEHYSENVVDTLHKKNLLLLGEDRYLTTLMLRTFPKRKQVFVPQAVCKTTVPNKFSILLSQRRRWINSTIHNLMELVLVRDLCGTFCFSMQFVVGIELLGTLVLPAAISFTIYLIVASIIDAVKGLPVPTIPLVMLCLILGLPAVLIVLTASRWSYVLWMLIYLLALPIWNGILPAYAYWKFDDFSWGDTRKTAGEGAPGAKKEAHGENEGLFDSSKIVMRRWVDFEQERRARGGAAAPGVSHGAVGGGVGARGSVSTSLGVTPALGGRSSSGWGRQAGPPSSYNAVREGRRASRGRGASGSRSRSRSNQRRPESHNFV